MKAYRRVGVKLNPFLISAPDGGQSQHHALATLTPTEIPVTHWVGPRADLDDLKNRKSLAPVGIKNPYSPARRYTDCAMPAILRSTSKALTLRAVTNRTELLTARTAGLRG
jgi:hypothetical protein